MVVIVIPAYNPDNKLLSLVKGLIANGMMHIVIVNDGSKQDSHEVFLRLSKMQTGDISIINHYVNLGKGRAIKTGINYVLNNYSECIGIVTADADGQHNPDDIKRIVEALNENIQSNNIILGCRIFQDNISVKVPLRSKIGNCCTKYILRYLCNIHVSDSQTGLRAIPRHLLPRLMIIEGERYEYETNMLLELVDENVDIIEVPISTIYEENNVTSHFNPITDSIKIYTVILKYSIASILSAFLDNLTFILLVPYCSNIWLLTYIGRTIAAIFNFSLNRRVVFKKQGNIVKQSFKYLCLLFISGALSAMLVQFLHNIFGTNIILLKMMIEVLLYFANFYIQKNFIFLTQEDKHVRKN